MAWLQRWERLTDRIIFAEGIIGAGGGEKKNAALWYQYEAHAPSRSATTTTKHHWSKSTAREGDCLLIKN